MASDWAEVVAERLRRLSVPEHEVVPIGIGGGILWSPEHEEEPEREADCPKCRGGIEPGSNRYCPKCKASGYDAKLIEQWVVNPNLPPDPEEKPAANKPKKRGRPRKNAGEEARDGEEEGGKRQAG